MLILTNFRLTQNLYTHFLPNATRPHLIWIDYNARTRVMIAKSPYQPMGILVLTRNRHPCTNRSVKIAERLPCNPFVPYGLEAAAVARTCRCRRYGEVYQRDARHINNGSSRSCPPAACAPSCESRLPGSLARRAGAHACP